MTTIKFYVFFFLLFVFSNSIAKASGICVSTDTIEICCLEISVCDMATNSVATDTLLVPLSQKEVMLTDETKPDDQKKKKRISAFFAFPFPFGFLGAHRVMLGTKPWIPIVYVATFGGCFGLLPLIDFCVILNAKDITQYENNPNLFMWIK